MRLPRAMAPALLCGLALLAAVGHVSAEWKLQCAAPEKGDPVISYTPLYGAANMSDSAWHDETWAFNSFGPITEMEVYHSGSGWHDPYIGFHAGGEFKGIRASYGGVTNNDTLLFGARKPHQHFSFKLEPEEKITKVELQHDSVMRWMAFTTNQAHRYEWGFKDMPGSKYFAISAPRDGAHLAAFRGFEGKQLPRSLGGYKKRYIVQLGFVWAAPDCAGGYQWVEPGPAPGGGVSGFFSDLFGSRPAGTPPAQRPRQPAALPPPQRLAVEDPPVMPEESAVEVDPPVVAVTPEAPAAAVPEAPAAAAAALYVPAATPALAAPGAKTGMPVSAEAARIPAPSRLVSGRIPAPAATEAAAAEAPKRR